MYDNIYKSTYVSSIYIKLNMWVQCMKAQHM